MEIINSQPKKKGGARPNAGRKSKAEEMELYKLLNKCWTKREREECIKKLAQRATKGDLESIKLLMAYTFGKPTERVEHSGKDGGAIPITVVEVIKPDGV